MVVAPRCGDNVAKCGDQCGLIQHPLRLLSQVPCGFSTINIGSTKNEIQQRYPENRYPRNDKRPESVEESRSRGASIRDERLMKRHVIWREIYLDRLMWSASRWRRSGCLIRC